MYPAMRALFRKIRESETWKGLSDLSVLVWVITLLIPIIAALAAWLHQEPLHKIILYFCVVGALSIVISYHWVKFREHSQHKQNHRVVSEAKARSKETDPSLVLINKRKKLEAELQPLLESEGHFRGHYEDVVARWATSEDRIRSEKIKRLTRDIGDITKLLNQQQKGKSSPLTSLTDGQRWVLKNKLAEYRGHPVALMLIGHDPQARVLFEQLIDIFNDSQWDISTSESGFVGVVGVNFPDGPYLTSSNIAAPIVQNVFSIFASIGIDLPLTPNAHGPDRPREGEVVIVIH